MFLVVFVVLCPGTKRSIMFEYQMERIVLTFYWVACIFNVESISPLGIAILSVPASASHWYCTLFHRSSVSSINSWTDIRSQPTLWQPSSSTSEVPVEYCEHRFVGWFISRRTPRR